MKITIKQKEEIDFYSSLAQKPFIPTDEEIEDYINETVNGIKKEHSNVWETSNRISDSKRCFEISSKMWREDLTRGMLGVNELLEDFSEYPFGVRLVNSIVKSVTPKYRKEILTKALEDKYFTHLCLTNFFS